MTTDYPLSINSFHTSLIYSSSHSNQSDQPSQPSPIRVNPKTQLGYYLATAFISETPQADYQLPAQSYSDIEIACSFSLLAFQRMTNATLPAIHHLSLPRFTGFFICYELILDILDRYLNFPPKNITFIVYFSSVNEITIKNEENIQLANILYLLDTFI